MRTETITLQVYEIGDVLAIGPECFKLTSKKHMMYNASRALVIDRRFVPSTGYSYRLIANNGKTVTLRSTEIGSEKFIAHIDMSPLLENTQKGGAE